VRRSPMRISSATVLFHERLGYFRYDKIPGLFFGSKRFSMDVKSQIFHPIKTLPSSVPVTQTLRRKQGPGLRSQERISFAATGGDLEGRPVVCQGRRSLQTRHKEVASNTPPVRHLPPHPFAKMILNVFRGSRWYSPATRRKWNAIT
jgi:hypothetical protein